MKETWQLVVAWYPELGKAVTHLLNLMHRTGRVPNAWNQSQAFQLGKNNGKTGCASVRLINLLAPDGKVSTSACGTGLSPRAWTGRMGSTRAGDASRRYWCSVCYGGSYATWGWATPPPSTTWRMPSPRHPTPVWTRWWTGVHARRTWAC